MKPRRLVLFDIDGTLLRGGPAKEAFRVAMTDTFGTAGRIERHEFSGKTDPQIARELLTDAGLDDAEVDAGFPRLWRRYLRELEVRIADHPPRRLPGVLELLDALERRADVALGLLTGNIAEGAKLKLASVGLHGRFPVGAFGSDHERRNRLPAIAVERARALWRMEFVPEGVVVVGDTPRDVECGRAGGHVTVAVATGRITREELLAAQADHLFDDLSRTDSVTEVLCGSAGAPGASGAPEGPGIGAKRVTGPSWDDVV